MFVNQQGPVWGYQQGSNLHNVMGSVGNLPYQQQNYFNQEQQNGFAGNFFQNQPSPIANNVGGGGGGNINWWDELGTPSLPSSPEKPKKGKRGNDKKAKRGRGGKKSNKERDDPKKVEKVTPKRKISEDTPTDLQFEEPPLLNLDQKSPPLWTMGCLFIFFAVLVCEILQTGTIAPMSVNPLIGPDTQTMLLMGAKYGPFMLSGQWWRFFTAIFLHSGLIHIMIVLFIVISTRSVEKDSGFFRAVLVFFISGLYGYILSCLFVPEMVTVGATGALYGFLGLQLSDLFSSWRMYPNRWSKLKTLLSSIITTLIVGFTPFLENFLHIGGFIMGFLFALMLLPNLSFGNCEKICHGFIAFLAFPIMATLFCLSFVVFYRSVDSAVSWCETCHYLNCINITGWCPPLTTSTSQKVFYFE